MATASPPAKISKTKNKNKSTERNSKTTVSGPARANSSGTGDRTPEKAAATQAVPSAFPFNTNKPAEYDTGALAPPEGAADAGQSDDEDAEPAAVGAAVKKMPTSKANSGNRR